ncbi:amidohydrolase [Aliiroseovarius sp. 2305UL8-7]|uniref:amidohydrolase n=2 Tax=Aliiroseovarius conchicola TaxID=3121637 RepID=UPI0035294104
MRNLLLSTIAYGALATSPALAQQTADLIIHNALVTTQDTSIQDATAVAVVGGRVEAVGTNSDVLELADDDTLVIDADGRRLIPGLNDGHVHAIIGGMSYALNVQWDGVPTLSRALEMLSEQAKRTPQGHWVKAIGGWSPHQFEEGRYPTMEELNAAVPDHPFMVQHAYNVAFLNEQALAILQEHAPFVFTHVPQTRWETDADGNYTGAVYGEPASWIFWILEAIVPQTQGEETTRSMQHMFRDMNRFGITSVSDGGTVETHPHSERTKSVYDADKSTVRISFMEIPSNGMEASIETMKDDHPLAPGQNLHHDLEHGFQFEGMGELLFASLETLQSISDWENFTQPIYSPDPDVIREQMYSDVSKLAAARIPFRVHATYNETISPMLDAIEKVNAETPLDGLRWSIEHAETISLENIDRIKALGGAIGVQNRMAMHGDDFIATNGEELALTSPPMRAMLDAGIPMSLGTDGLRASNFNPWTAMDWATTGRSVSGAIVLGEENRLTREEALYAYTVGSAWHQFQEDEKGRIAPGQLADMALLSADYFTVPDDEISSIQSVLTIMDGEVVYGSGPYEGLSPELPAALPEWAPINYFTIYE